MDQQVVFLEDLTTGAFPKMIFNLHFEHSQGEIHGNSSNLNKLALIRARACASADARFEEVLR